MGHIKALVTGFLVLGGGFALASAALETFGEPPAWLVVGTVIAVASYSFGMIIQEVLR